MNKFDETYFKILHETKSLYDDSIFVGDNMIFLWNKCFIGRQNIYEYFLK